MKRRHQFAERQSALQRHVPVLKPNRFCMSASFMPVRNSTTYHRRLVTHAQARRNAGYTNNTLRPHHVDHAGEAPFPGCGRFGLAWYWRCGLAVAARRGGHHNRHSATLRSRFCGAPPLVRPGHDRRCFQFAQMPSLAWRSRCVHQRTACMHRRSWGSNERVNFEARGAKSQLLLQRHGT